MNHDRSSTLTLHELYNIRSRNRQRKNVSYQRILEMCHTRIRNVTRAGGLHCFFEVPPFVFGLPMFSQKECTEFLVEKLSMIGLVAREHPNQPFVVYISWDPKEIKDLRQQITRL